MIGTLQRVSWLSVVRDPVVVALTFALPILFFTVFAFVFGGGTGGASYPPLAALTVDEDATDPSRRLIAALGAMEALELRTHDAEGRTYDRESARRALRKGEVSVVVVVMKGFGDSFARKGRSTLPVLVLHDAAQPAARHVVAGLLQAAAHRAAPERLIQRSLEQLEPFGAPISVEQVRALDALQPYLRGEAPWGERPGARSDDLGWIPGAPEGEALVPVETLDVRGETKSLAAYYAASLAVMFMLFSLSGAAGALIGEAEGGTLDRILMSNAGMGTLLASYFLFFVSLATLQVTTMFVFGSVAFDVGLFVPHRLAGFAVMTLATASAASAFGLMLGTACQSRGQLSAISTLVILLMSALGGSMVPRFAMPDFMATVSLFTLNGWAIDGFLQVFWHDDPSGSTWRTLEDVLPAAGVLMGMTVVFGLLARRLAQRWEAR